jgi:hypothetical protein
MSAARMYVDPERPSVEGEFVETVCGIPGARCEIAMLRPPDGGSRQELASFVTPDHVPPIAHRDGQRDRPAQRVLRGRRPRCGHRCCGCGRVWARRGIGEYENSVRMAYVRGPEGIIVSLFERTR